ncbi:MAG: fimbrillin family protein [Bacteroidaceae bacterium]|nr:fimbrillin family protein [Bacteroidaceae bacterium]
MKKEMFYMAVLLFCSACDKEADYIAEERVPIMLGTTIEAAGAETRTQSTTALQNTELANGQAVGVFIYNAGTKATQTTYGGYKNISYSVSGTAGDLTSSTQPYYPANASQTVDIYAFSPREAYTATNADLSGLTAVTGYSVSTNQSSDDGYKASDFVWGTGNSSAAAVKSRSDKKVLVTLGHKMSRIIVRLTEGNGMSGRLAGATVKINNVVVATKINLTTGVVEAATGSTQSAVTLGSNISVSSNMATCIGVIPPQSIAACGLITITLSDTYGNSVYTYTTTAASTFTANNQYVYNITVHATGLQLTTSISPWGDETTAGTGTAIFS